MSPEAEADFLNTEFTPHEYQIDCLNVLSLVRSKEKQKALIVMATGLGKTAVAAFDAANFLAQNRGNGRVLYLCHQIDILVQARGTFEKIFREDNKYGYFHGDRKDFDANILFASFQTMQDWKDKFPRDYFDYVVVDESHHSPADTYLPTVNYFTPSFLLAVTATPDRNDLLDIRRIFGKEVFNLSLEKALVRGYLTSVDYRIMTDKVLDYSVLGIPAGKLTVAQLNRELFLPRRDEEIARIIKERMEEVKEPKVIVFCRNIQHAELIAKLLPQSLPYHSRQPRNMQVDILNDFRNAQSRVIVTVDKFNEGVDIPEANILVFLRSTKSKTVFYQQLGRGLRRVQGKDSVIVLDFVGNVKRLEVLENLKKKIQIEVQKIRKVDDGELSTSRGLIFVDTGNFSFDEQAINILNLLDRAREGYTKQALIDQLLKYYNEFKKIPTWDVVVNLSKDGQIASVGTFARFFGSFQRALLEAGFSKDDMKVITYPEEELISQLKHLKEELGRVPTQEDVDTFSKEGKCASSNPFRRIFGSFGNALIAAGMVAHKNTALDKDIMLVDLKALSQRLGRTPSLNDIFEARKKGEIQSSVASYTKLFGSLNSALKEAGLPLTKMRVRKDSELLEELKELAIRLGKIPTNDDVDNASSSGECASASTYRRRFGSIVKAAEQISLPLSGKTKATKELLLRDLINLANDLGGVPTTHDLEEALGHTIRWSYTTYLRTFGSYKAALIEAGLKKEIVD